MDSPGLTHQDCLSLLGVAGCCVTATVAVDGGSPVPVAAFVQPGGDVLVPTGIDPSLPRAAVGRPVTVEIDGGEDGWLITGVGLARPLGHRDRPRADHPHAMLYAFDNGFRVRIARLTGQRVDGAPPIPRQRTGASPGAVLSVPRSAQ